MNRDDVEKEIKSKGLTAPRVAKEHVDASINYWEFHAFPSSQMTVCCIKMNNGFCVTGESSCASPENFNRELGESIALTKAKDKIWELLAFDLCQTRYLQEPSNDCAGIPEDCKTVKEN